MSSLVMILILFTFVLLAMLFSFLLYQVTEKKTLSVIAFTVILVIPFWDLMLQKGIKEYYILNGLLEPTIYAHLEKNENGMIESLQVTTENSNYYIQEFQQGNIEKVIQRNYGKILKEKIKYLDFIFPVSRDSKVFRFYLENGKVAYKVLDKQQARYKFQWEKHKTKLFGLYNIGGQEILDTKTNEILAKSFSITFKDIFTRDNIREEILFKMTGLGTSTLYVPTVSYSDTMWRKVIWKY